MLPAAPIDQEPEPPPWECPVCYEDDRRTIVILECKHQLCFACVRRMLESNTAGSCPLCRAIPPDLAQVQEEVVSREQQQAQAMRKREQEHVQAMRKLEEQLHEAKNSEDYVQALENQLVATQIKLRAAQRRLQGKPLPRTFNSTGLNNFSTASAAPYQNMQFGGVKPKFS